jgi:restriction system protein
MPTWEGFLVHVLTALADGHTRAKRDLVELVADVAELTPEQRLETITSGGRRYQDRIGWSMSSLVRADAIERPSRAHYSITAVGRRLLEEHPHGLGEAQLREIAAYRDYVPSGKQGATVTTPPAGAGPASAVLDPREQISAGIEQIHADVAVELLRRIRDAEPAFLEQAVVDLLVAMGYGGADERRVRRIGGSGDGGVDGVIDQDPLGLGRIYVQAKRYAPENVVGRPAIQAFVGALQGQQADQGVFITTSTFSREAVEYARHVNAAVVLIDGRRLSELLIQYRVGAQAEETYTVVKIDDDYFDR